MQSGESDFIERNVCIQDCQEMNVIVWIKIKEANTTEAKKSTLSPENVPSKQC